TLGLAPLVFTSYCDRRDLHSFPTRRSSDLGGGLALLIAVLVGGTVLMRRRVSEAEQRQRAVEARARTILNTTADGILALDSSGRSEEHTSELQSRENLVCRLLLEKKNITAY